MRCSMLFLLRFQAENRIVDVQTSEIGQTLHADLAQSRLAGIAAAGIGYDQQLRCLGIALAPHVSPPTENAVNGNLILMAVIVEAVEANATVGEISDAMRHVYGAYRETVVFEYYSGPDFASQIWRARICRAPARRDLLNYLPQRFLLGRSLLGYIADLARQDENVLETFRRFVGLQPRLVQI
jgi:hypothetical protein